MRGLALGTLVMMILAGCAGPANDTPIAPPLTNAPPIQPPAADDPQPLTAEAPSPEELEATPVPPYNVTHAELIAELPYPTVGIPAPFRLVAETDTGADPEWTIVGAEATITGDQALIEFDSPEPQEIQVIVHGASDYAFNVSVDPWNPPYDFGTPDEKPFRPGKPLGPCTSNVLMTWQWERYFYALAAHCVTDEPATGQPNETGQCDDHPWDRDKPVLWNNQNGETATIVYNSVEVMQRLGWSYDNHSDACVSNDFALVEVPPEYLPQMHPAMMAFGGPTHLANASAFETGQEMRGYGHSTLRYMSGDIQDNPATHESNKKVGIIVEPRGDFAYNLYAVTPAIPGDSGSPMFTMDGGAWGIASQLRTVGGMNTYTRLDAALDFMEEHEGWRPMLVTTDIWDPTFPST